MYMAIYEIVLLIFDPSMILPVKFSPADNFEQ